MTLRWLQCVLALGLTLAFAQPGAFAPPPTSVALQAFFEEELPPLMEKHAVPGVAISVVAGGEVRHAAGYGAARLDPDLPATADTPFVTGSVSKMLTFTALMQQVERGAIDLDADVNDYLQPFQVPAAFGEPVRVRHLLTHTAGFEDRPFVGLLARDEAALAPLADLLVRHMPARVRPPGREAAYSNYGAALAGYLVEVVSGIPFAAYVEREILTPLGMTSSSFEQPLQGEMAARAAYGYLAEGGSYVSPGPEYVPLAPAGALRMSARDAAAFMLLHLGERSGVLSEETVLAMRQPLHQARSDMPGMAHGWWQSRRHGRELLTHEGDVNESHALLALIPETGEGLFLATNSPGGTLLRAELWEAYLGRFHPVSAPTASGDAALSDYEGFYLINRYSTSTIGKLGLLLSSMSVSASADGLTLPPLLGPEPMLLVPQGDDVFVDLDTDLQVFFTRDASGAVSDLHLNPSMVFHRPRPWQHPVLHLCLLGGALLGSLAALVALLVRGRGWSAPERWVLVATASGPIAFVVAMILFVPDPFAVAFGATPGLLAALTVANLAAAASLLGAVALWRMRRRRTVPRGVMIAATVAVVAALVFAAELQFWNLLGYRL